MWLMLQHDVPEDFVLATGEAHSIREFVETAFELVNIKIIWKGHAENEVGIDLATGKILVKVNKDFYRPADVNISLGDASKAKKILNWHPKILFRVHVT